MCDSAATVHHLTTDCRLNFSCNYTSSASGGMLQLPTFTTAAKARVVITCILCGISALCNLAVLWAAHADGKRKSHVKIFLFRSVTICSPEDFTQCTTRGSFSARWHETAYNMFTFCCLFLLPLVIMITCYTRIFCEISRRLRKDNLPSSEVNLRCSKNNIPRARMRTLKMSIVIVLSFIICWTPYYLLGLWYWFFPDDLEGKVSHTLTHILFIFGLGNACLDPVIYGLFTIHFRKRLQRRYCNTSSVSELDNNTVINGSFTCAANSLSLKREVSPAAR
ncbi:gonadotropin-releasing hormone II receptor-like isoform X2 [Antennarius striatus]|uniref:gonadotropin-releasing hormone II receptor-like isoform X2 n=1 Tax=Antennarius striatus TaxID=241820 RepID=UPI0035B4E27E